MLRSFVAVVETGSLGKAAAQLGTTQPSVSRHMRELEKSLGETLFDRRPSGMVVSERATALYESVRGMQDLAQRAEGLLRHAPRGITGTVRVTTSAPFAVHVVAPWLTPLMHKEPGLEIELRATAEIENLLRRDADIAIRFVRPLQDGVIARRVGQVTVGLYVSADYREKFGVPKTMQEGLSHLLIGGNNTVSQLPPSGLQPGGLQLPPGIHFRFRTDSELARLAAVQAGMGIGPVIVDIAQRLPNLHRVLEGEFSLPLEIWLCGHDDLRRSARIGRVYDHLCERLLGRFGDGVAT